MILYALTLCCAVYLVVVVVMVVSTNRNSSVNSVFLSTFLFLAN